MRGFCHHMPQHQSSVFAVYTTVFENRRIGSQPTRHAYWLSASPHNASFLLPYPVLYHYRYVPGKDNDMYIYSTGVTCLVGSRWADNPLLSSLKLSLHFLFFFAPPFALVQQAWGIYYLSPNLLCFLSQWFINRVLLCISKGTGEGECGGGRQTQREGEKKRQRRQRRRDSEGVYELRCLWRRHSDTVCWYNG